MSDDTSRTTEEQLADHDNPDHPENSEPTGEEPGKKKKRRRRRRRRKSSDAENGSPAQTESGSESEVEAGVDADADQEPEAPKRPVPKRRREVKPVDASDPDLFDQEIGWEQMGLAGAALEGLKAAGFKKPTFIQSMLIPRALTGRDVLGQAKTGTGKTAAFGLPLIQMVTPGDPFQALILAPTRELATQIGDEIRSLGKFTDLSVVPVYGGQSIRIQAEKLSRKPEIIVGTPGRIMDMVERRYLSLKHVKFAVLDEVDRMLDIGFRDDIRRILGMCPKDRQTMVVSATISPDIEDLARRYMREPEKIVTAKDSLTVRMVKQYYLPANPWDKRRLLIHLLTHEEPALTVVFCRLKRTVDQVTEKLIDKGIDAHAMHGDMRQAKRESVLKQIKKGGLGVLVASDLASRGLDIEGITHVINYDLPDDPEVYVHRIGRTARAGREGIAWSFVTPEQGKLLTEIENLTNAEIPKLEYPDFEPSERPKNWRDEPTGGRPPVEVRGVDKPARNRLEAAAPPPASKIDEKKLAAKFPGGIVPTKLPGKRMGGKVRTARSNKLDL